MHDIYGENKDSEYYGRVGRQMIIREAWSLFGDFGTRAKKALSNKLGGNAIDNGIKHKC